MAALVPQAKGFLEATPFAHLLAHALDHRLTGTLVLEEPEGLRHGVYFESGAPRKAKTALPVVHLGEVLVSRGAITPASYERTLARAQSERKLHGQVLLAEGLVSPQSLGSGLREQLSQQLLWLFGRPPTTRFGYFDGSDLLETWGSGDGARVNAIELIWQGIRDHAPEREIHAVLGQVGGRRLVLRGDMPLDYFFFMGKDRAIVDRLRDTPMNVAELVTSSRAPFDRVERVLALLIVTRSLDLGARSAPPLGLDTNTEPPPVVPPPPSLPSVVTESTVYSLSAGPNQAEREDEAFDDEGTPDAGGALEPLVLDELTPSESYDQSEEFQEPESTLAAFETQETEPPPPFEGELQAIPGPPNLPGAQRGAALAGDEAPLAPSAGDDAHAVDPSGRASNAFARAEGLLAGGNLSAARGELRIALDLDPQPPYLALQAWLELHDESPDLRNIARNLERAYRSAESNPTVRYYRGLVFQRLGKHAAALQEFRAVLERAPRHIDAARQVRIYELRLQRSPKDRPSLSPEEDGPDRRRSLFSWLRR